MKYLLVMILFFFFEKPVFSQNIFELTALSFGIPLLYDQYFDKSLFEKNDFDRRTNLLNKYYKVKTDKNFKINLNSKSDVIEYLIVTDKLYK